MTKANLQKANNLVKEIQFYEFRKLSNENMLEKINWAISSTETIGSLIHFSIGDETTETSVSPSVLMQCLKLSISETVQYIEMIRDEFLKL